jgi:hypothetical protein
MFFIILIEGKLMQKKLLFMMSIITKYIFAYTIPTIAVPNLVYLKTVKTPISSASMSTNLQTDSTTPRYIKQQVEQDLPMFNADVKGALINSTQFKVIDLPKANKIWNGNSQAMLNLIDGLNKTTIMESKVIESQKTIYTSNNSNLPDYILLGQILSITSDSDIEPIQDTNKMTSQYNIDISVDYQLVGVKDGAVIASFNAYGHANDVKILNANDEIKSQQHNIPLLINQASKDLATNVISQLQQQFRTASKTYKIESIENVKVY